MVNGPPTSRLRAVIWTLSGDMEYFARELSINIEIFIELALLMVRMRPSCLETNPGDPGHVERTMHFGEHKKATHASTL